MTVKNGRTDEKTAVQWAHRMVTLTKKEQDIRSFRAPARGEIWAVDLGSNVGSEENNIRPCLVIQEDSSNRMATTTVVIPITKNQPRFFSHVRIRLDDTLEDSCKIDGSVMTEQIRVISKARLGKRPIGTVTEDMMARVEDKVNLALGIDA